MKIFFPLYIIACLMLAGCLPFAPVTVQADFTLVAPTQVTAQAVSSQGVSTVFIFGVLEATPFASDVLFTMAAGSGAVIVARNSCFPLIGGLLAALKEAQSKNELTKVISITIDGDTEEFLICVEDIASTPELRDASILVYSKFPVTDQSEWEKLGAQFFKRDIIQQVLKDLYQSFFPKP